MYRFARLSAASAVVLTLAGCAWLGGNQRSEHGGVVPTTPTSSEYQDMKWTPDAAYTDGEPLFAGVTLRSDGTYVASDGCNSSVGTYAVSEGGFFKVETDGMQTLMGCHVFNMIAALEGSNRLVVESGHLTLYSDSEVVLELNRT